MSAYINFMEFKRSPNSFGDSYSFMNSATRLFLQRSELLVLRCLNLHGILYGDVAKGMVHLELKRENAHRK